MSKIEMYQGKAPGGSLPEKFCRENYENVKRFHESMESFTVTPLVRLEETERRTGIGRIFIKDESKRYGLNAFKALGAAYAVSKIVKKLDGRKPVFVTATDGNHGRAVAWAAYQAGCPARIYMPKGTVQARVDAIHQVSDAEVTVTDVSYGQCVRMAAEYAKEHDGYLVQDTGFEGYEDIPWDITLGYSKMIAEAIEQLDGVKPTHVFLQAGVGSMAGGVAGYLKDYYGEECPVISIMEEWDSACIYESAVAGQCRVTDGIAVTIMAGLNCEEPNILTLPVLLEHASFFFKMDDTVTMEGMRQLAKEGIVAGECGGIGTGLLLKMDQDMKDALGLDEHSVVLLFSTEGATDPENYAKIVKEE